VYSWSAGQDSAGLWQRIHSFVPSRWWAHTRVVGLHHNLSLLRYESGQKQFPHRDGVAIKANGNRSYLALMLFLNTEYTGGETHLLSPPIRYPESDQVIAQKVKVDTPAGSVLIIQNDLFHESTEVLSGNKYVVKAEVMFTAINSVNDDPAESSTGPFKGVFPALNVLGFSTDKDGAAEPNGMQGFPDYEPSFGYTHY